MLICLVAFKYKSPDEASISTVQSDCYGLYVYLHKLPKPTNGMNFLIGTYQLRPFANLCLPPSGMILSSNVQGIPVINVLTCKPLLQSLSNFLSLQPILYQMGKHHQQYQTLPCLPWLLKSFNIFT